MNIVESRKPSYFVRHWRGDLSLPVSYWVNCVVLSLVVQGTLTLARGGVDLTDWPQLLGAGMVLLWIAILLISVWQIVGTWRAAGSYRRRGGARLWAGATRVMLVLAALGTAGNIITIGIPQSMEFGKIALRLDYEPAQVSVIDSGRVIAIEGPIGFGLTQDVKALLDRNPDVRTIELSSIGGRVQEARKLQRLIADRQLNTSSSKGCFSACTIAFMAGAERRLSPRASLGFHRYHFPGSPDSVIRDLESADRQFLISRGLPGDFVARIYSTPHADMWQPSHAELLRAGAVTSFAMTEREEAEFRQFLVGHKLYGAIREFEPATYAALEAKAKEMLLQGRFDDFRTVAQPLVVSVYLKYLPRASDEAVRATIAVTIEEGNLLRTADTDSCFAYFYPDPSRPLTVTPTIAPDVLDREFSAMAAVIRSGARGDLPVATEQARADMIDIHTRIVARMGDSFAFVPVKDASTREQRAAKCDYTLMMLEEMLRLPGARAPELMRILTAGGLR